MVSYKMELSAHSYKPTFLVPIPNAPVFRLQGIPGNNAFRPYHSDRNHHLSVKSTVLVFGDTHSSAHKSS